MDFSALAGISSNTDTTADRKPKHVLGKEDFMHLLIKQLSYQDPLNPLDSTEFTSQLTQFTSLEELNNINNNLKDMLASQNSVQNATVTNLIGKSVKASGDSVYLEDTADLSFELAKEALSVKLTIYDNAGKVVKIEEAGHQQAGSLTYSWDGKDFLGNNLPDGTYRYEVEALNSEGEPVDVTKSSEGYVTGISFDDNVTYLTLNGGRTVHLSDIQSVKERRN